MRLTQRIERNADIVRMRAGGATYRDIGQKHHVCKQRVRQILVDEGIEGGERAAEAQSAGGSRGILIV